VEYHIDSQIKADQIEIPSLITQPFVENAILHGLYNSDEQGLLKINVLKQNNSGIVIQIEDNGVGREQAMILKQKNFHGHQSLGMMVTKERIEIINRETEVSLDIEDLRDNEDKPCGTRVSIHIAATV
jgi:sensor histidine kinase YesM